MAQYVPDLSEARAAHCKIACCGMAQIMNIKILKACPSPDQSPGVIDTKFMGRI